MLCRGTTTYTVSSPIAPPNCTLDFEYTTRDLIALIGMKDIDDGVLGVIVHTSIGKPNQLLQECSIYYVVTAAIQNVEWELVLLAVHSAK